MAVATKTRPPKGPKRVCFHGLGRCGYHASMAGKRQRRTLKPDEPVPEGVPSRYVRKDGYVILSWREAPNRYVQTYEHRLVVGLPVGRHVHHRNHHPSDNDADNLEPLTPSEHWAQHRVVDDERVARLYQAGKRVGEIAEAVGVDTSTVSRSLTRSGIERRPRSEIGPRIHLPTEEVRCLYLAGASLVTVAQRFGCSKGVVARTLKEAGVSLRGPGGPAGGRVRGQRLSPERKREIGRLAAEARWRKFRAR